MYELYAQGATLAQVGEQFGVSPSHVSKLFKGAGLKVRRRGTSRTSRTRPLIPEMYALYEQGASLREVGEQFGISMGYVGNLFKDAGLTTRAAPAANRTPEMYALYEQGATLQEVGDEFGVSRERVRQVFSDAGLKIRSMSEVALLKRETDRQRVEEILESFYRLKNLRLVALELEIALSTVRSVLRERLPRGEYRMIGRKPAKKTYSDEELIGFLVEANGALGGTLTNAAYNAFARGRRMTDGRPWPTHQAPLLRFGSWRNALIAAGLHANPSSPITGKTRFDTDVCVEAIRTVNRELGEIPTARAYEQYVQSRGETLPSASTVRHRCGTWNEALRMAGL